MDMGSKSGICGINHTKNIVSASRRSDIPAFLGDWFMRCVEAGRAECANPFGGAAYTVPLGREDVALFVFWSKNFRPFMPHLEALDRNGYKFYFQHTINGYPGWLEPRVPPLRESLDTALRLAGRYGAERVLWRFDPIVFSSETPPEMIIETFSQIAAALDGAVNRCYISFAQLYGKLRRGLRRLREERGVTFRFGEEFRGKNETGRDGIKFDLTERERREFAARLAAIAASHGISMHACCQEYLLMPFETPAITKASCIDFELASRICGEPPAGRAAPARKQCGCHYSRDIGAYSTCGHGCVYCYAGGAAGSHSPNVKASDRQDACPTKLDGQL